MNENIMDLNIARNVFGNDEELYKHYLFQFAERDLFGKMQMQLNQNNTQEAFETAHLMKGLVQNLALKELGDALNPAVEVLRSGVMPSEEQINFLKEKYDETLNYIYHIKENQVSVF